MLITHEADIAAYGTRIITVRDGVVLSDMPNTPRDTLEQMPVPLAAAG